MCALTVGVAFAMSASLFARRDLYAGGQLEVLPRHFVLHPGEQIHSTVAERSEDGKARFADGKFSIENTQIVRIVKPTGVLEAVKAGRPALVVRTRNSVAKVERHDLSLRIRVDRAAGGGVYCSS